MRKNLLGTLTRLLFTTTLKVNLYLYIFLLLFIFLRPWPIQRGLYLIIIQTKIQRNQNNAKNEVQNNKIKVLIDK